MLAGNLRYTFRSFRKNPGFTAIAVLSLALGIGANTAIFSLLDRVMLRSLPVRDPQQLVLFTANGPRRGSVNTNYDDTFTFSYPMYLDFRDRAPDLSGAIAWYPISASLSLNGTTERVAANLVSGNFFEVLGAGTAIGRPIIPDDTRSMGANAVAVLSYGFWQQRFGGDPGILNRQVSINGQPLTVVGVAARGLRGRRDGRSAGGVHSCHHETPTPAGARADGIAPQHVAERDGAIEAGRNALQRGSGAQRVLEADPARRAEPDDQQHGAIPPTLLESPYHSIGRVKWHIDACGCYFASRWRCSWAWLVLYC